jgi:hypothetical protein
LFANNEYAVVRIVVGSAADVDSLVNLSNTTPGVFTNGNPGKLASEAVNVPGIGQFRVEDSRVFEFSILTRR